MASFQCLSSTNGDLIAVRGASPAAVASDPVQTDTVVPTAAVGVAATLRFGLRPPTPTHTGRLALIGSFAWEVTVGGGAGATGRLNLTLLRNGLAITGVTAAQGATQVLDAVVGPFREVLVVELPEGTLIDADDVFEVAVQIERVVAGAAGNATVRVHHNPAVIGDSFPVEISNLAAFTGALDGLASRSGTPAAAGFSLEDAASVQTFSDPVETDTVVATDGAANTVVATHAFELRPGQGFRERRVDLFALVRWQTTAAGGAGGTGRLNLGVLLNGAAIAGVATVPGTTRAFDAIAGPFNELLHLVIPSLSMDQNDVLAVTVEVERRAAGAAGNATVQVHHDPVAAGDELFVEMTELPN
ncbi:MAG: hypothetical protein Q8Q14_09150 [Gemmatimonadales bacterium]|nr:hypothetical protein [Gemmatimonadales bacterium]